MIHIYPTYMNTKEIIISTAQNVLDKMGFKASVSWIEGKDIKPATLSIQSDDQQGMLIGKEGATLDALEHVIHALAGKAIRAQANENMPNFLVDVNNYRSSYIDNLLSQARKIAQQVVETRRAQTLPPMNALQRRLIHTELATIPRIATESSGDEPNRRVIIKPASDI